MLNTAVILFYELGNQISYLLYKVIEFHSISDENDLSVVVSVSSICVLLHLFGYTAVRLAFLVDMYCMSCPLYAHRIYGYLHGTTFTFKDGWLLCQSNISLPGWNLKVHYRVHKYLQL